MAAQIKATVEQLDTLILAFEDDNLYRLLDARNNKETPESYIVKELIKEIKSTTTKIIPRSISLFQYCFAILIDKNIIQLPIENYYCHITEEFKTLYPNIATDSNYIFEYEARH